MITILPALDADSAEPLYLQLFNYIKEAIMAKQIVPDEKLPSLRNLSESLSLSMTTVEMAYDQLAVEGYIYSRPQSGFFVREMHYPDSGKGSSDDRPASFDNVMELAGPDMKYDISCFDFPKWKKCMNHVLNDYPQLLLFESDPQGEQALRFEISKYVYQSRGVRCTPDDIVIAAGTQQITSYLSNMMHRAGIEHVAVESPGYRPVNNIFRDRGLAITHVGVASDGIEIDRLPANISAAAYVSPSNQFPTGTVMPVGKRYQLLDWAKNNDSFIIEDDYDSELRYFGKPVPALQGLDREGRVIYLGSFSSTLFSAVKISYMVLPPAMAAVFSQIRNDYSQTCSKEEQLTLALFMEQGHYQTGIKKMRRLYSQKLHAVLKAFYGAENITVVNTESGINIIIKVDNGKDPATLCSESRQTGVPAIPAASYIEGPLDASLVLYYNQIPQNDIPATTAALISRWNSLNE